MDLAGGDAVTTSKSPPGAIALPTWLHEDGQRDGERPVQEEQAALLNPPEHYKGLTQLLFVAAWIQCARILQPQWFNIVE
jgi:hypothetical protein